MTYLCDWGEGMGSNIALVSDGRKGVKIGERVLRVEKEDGKDLLPCGHEYEASFFSKLGMEEKHDSICWEVISGCVCGGE